MSATFVGSTSGLDGAWTDLTQILAFEVLDSSGQPLPNARLTFDSNATYRNGSLEISLATSPPGLTVTVDGVEQQTPATTRWPIATQHTLSTTSPQITPGSRHVFKNWSGGQGPTQTVTPLENTVYTAVFDSFHRLNLTANPPQAGAVVATGIPADGYIAAGTSVPITATPQPGYVFMGYSGDSAASTASINLIMDTPKSLTANFVPCSYSFGTVPSVGHAGGPVEVAIVTQVGCPWAATGLPSWISPIGSSTGAGPGVLRLRIEPNTNSTPRSVSLTVAGQPLSILQQGLVCSFVFSPASEAIDAAGGVRRITVTPNDAACAWNVQSGASWISIDSGASGTGSGMITYSVGSHTGAASRSGLLTIAGNPFVITQSGSNSECIYTASPSLLTVAQAGGTGSISITTQAGCAWQATTATSWVIFSGAGAGPGNVSYTVQSNPGALSRSATLLVGGQTITLTQAGAGTLCTPVASLSTFPAAGSSQTVTVNIAAGCGWQVLSSVPWLSLSSGASGTGSGSFVLTAAANGDATLRTATITINGQPLAVSQAGTGTGLQFVPVNPCRVADTRPGSGLPDAFGGPVLEGGTTRILPIPSGRCGIPAEARAYSLNITVVPESAMLQFLTLWPAGQARPNASTLNSFDGKIVSNAALVPAGANGSVVIYVTDRAHVIVDLNGYFVP